ncbi:MFS transporter [Ovoidimarina sediminis]|uniref:MFS transporter n=1 Tax=Ovoidimarina sediminis TaxID=3079856 RepID=UPI002912BA03|nr:MFS transporter [Rhodophyticola sp. MJ-SS7]MDU8941881.1 MFS transporter [Rhodophyticola sp. MJ-SS7]
MTPADSPDHDLHDTRYAWFRLAVTLLVACVGNVGMWAVIVILPDMQAEFGIDRGTASLPYTACMAGFAIGSLAIGRWVDRYGITPCIIATAALMSAGYTLAVLSHSVWALIALHGAIGFGAAANFGPLIADISHWFMRRRGIAVAITASGNYLSGAIWPLLLSGLLDSYGWRGVYVALAVIVPALAIPLSLVLRRRISEAATARADSAAAARRGATGLAPAQLQLMLIVAGVACCMAMAMPQVHIVALCADLGFGPAVGAEMLSLMLLGGVASRLVSGFLADRIGGILTLLTGSVLQCIALFLYLPAGGLTSLYVVSLVFGLSQGGIVPSYSIVVREYMPAREAGARVGSVTFATIVGMAVGGWASGWIYDATGSYDMAFLHGIAWNVLNIGIVVTILLLTRRRLAPA